jgi:diacylglycerol kinase family enzyme
VAGVRTAEPAKGAPISASTQHPGGFRRLSATLAILLIVAVAVATLVLVVTDPLRVLAQLLLLLVLVAAGWIAITRTGSHRTIAVIVGAVTLVALLASVVGAEGYLGVALVVQLALLALALRLAKHALATTDTALKASETPGTPVPAATRGVLFMNLKSGGGKAQRFHLVDECRRRGIDPVVLEPGMDWLQTVRDTAASGSVDVLGMAGGDGSQAMVGTVAAEFGLPMVVVPAGTRNHLALDLGLDRDDVVGALDAYEEAVERTMDLADVNGHVFVNNVSLGLYAAIVRSPAYRDAKADTTLATLPQVLGPDTQPFDLRFTGPNGEEHQGAHVIQISNNPYGATVAGLGSRPRLDTRTLGIITLVLDERGDARSLLAAIATGHPDHFHGLTSWAAPTFEVTSKDPIEIGLDGETEVMDPPLHFSIRPSPVRVRLPKRAIGYSPAARSLGWRETIRRLWAVALGRAS